MKNELENLGKFLINIEIATRKWILRDLDEDEEEETINDKHN
jgi:predicted hydrolase (HD superfamily)